jgi:hypothetical protein
MILFPSFIIAVCGKPPEFITAYWSILEFTHVTANPSFSASLTTLFENPGTSDSANAVLQASSASALYPRLLATRA